MLSIRMHEHKLLRYDPLVCRSVLDVLLDTVLALYLLHEGGQVGVGLQETRKVFGHLINDSGKVNVCPGSFFFLHKRTH